VQTDFGFRLSVLFSAIVFRRIVFFGESFSAAFDSALSLSAFQPFTSGNRHQRADWISTSTSRLHPPHPSRASAIVASTSNLGASVPSGVCVPSGSSVHPHFLTTRSASAFRASFRRPRLLRGVSLLAPCRRAARVRMSADRNALVCASAPATAADASASWRALRGLTFPPSHMADSAERWRTPEPGG
jgi:hypothetical protein